MKFSLGPWVNNGFNVNAHAFDIATHDNSKLIARVSIFTNEIETRESESNANLISAAPDLYSALEDIVRQLQAAGIAGDFKFDRIQAALYKADGGLE